MTGHELKVLLGHKRLPTSGTKAKLITRLSNWFKTSLKMFKEDDVSLSNPGKIKGNKELSPVQGGDGDRGGDEEEEEEEGEEEGFIELVVCIAAMAVEIRMMMMMMMMVMMVMIVVAMVVAALKQNRWPEV